MKTRYIVLYIVIVVTSFLYYRFVRLIRGNKD